ncbi:MAG: YncE family protein [Ferruginibacter sp.]
MKKILIPVLLIASTLFIFNACKKKNDAAVMGKNINYPAVYVVNGGSSTISVINLNTNNVSDSIGLLNPPAMNIWPHHIYHHQSSTMHHLAVGVPGMDLSAGHTGGMPGMTGAFLILDAEKGVITKEVTLPMMNHNATYSPDGSEIWTTQMDIDGRVLVYDANTYAVKSNLTVGEEPAEVTFSADGTKAYVCNGASNTVTVIDPASKNILSTINVGTNPVGAWPSTIGKMFVDCEDGQTIEVIDVASDTKVVTIDLGFMPGYAAYNPTTSELWVSNPMDGKVSWYMDMGSNTWMQHGEFTTGAGAHAIIFYNGYGYVTNQEANTVSLVNASNHSKVKDIPVGDKPNGITIKN